MNKYNMSRNDNKYKYNYEEEVKDSEYLTINVNLKNKVVIAILVIMCISLVGLLILQIGKYSNNGRSFIQDLVVWEIQGYQKINYLI